MPIIFFNILLAKGNTPLLYKLYHASPNFSATIFFKAAPASTASGPSILTSKLSPVVIPNPRMAI
jgi:hypothetical protein